MKNYTSGTLVRITSKKSRYKGFIGTVAGYCKGRYKNICRIALSPKHHINIFDDGLELVTN